VHEGVTPVVYCTVGMRASHMYFVLRYLGYDPKFYDGSINDWNRRHYPLATGTARGTP
jgi:3-mercaptopyruvate sulfurtransferase SseA